MCISSPKQAEFIQLKILRLRVRVPLKDYLVPTAFQMLSWLEISSIVKIFNIAKESYEIVPVTIINHNVLFTAFSTRVKNFDDNV